jgi:hypothetical protein
MAPWYRNMWELAPDIKCILGFKLSPCSECSFVWVIPRRLNAEAGESPKRKNTMKCIVWNVLFILIISLCWFLKMWNVTKCTVCNQMHGMNHINSWEVYAWRWQFASLFRLINNTIITFVYVFWKHKVLQRSILNIKCPLFFCCTTFVGNFFCSDEVSAVVWGTYRTARVQTYLHLLSVCCCYPRRPVFHGQYSDRPVGGSTPGGGEIFCVCRRPRVPPSLPCNGYDVCPGSNVAVALCWPPTRFERRGCEWVGAATPLLFCLRRHDIGWLELKYVRRF